MAWFLLNRPSFSSNFFAFNTTDICSEPFTYNNINFDYDNAPAYIFNIYSNNKLNSYKSFTIDSPIYKIKIASSRSGSSSYYKRTGFPYLIKSDLDLKTKYNLNELPNDNISGRYKLKYNNEPPNNTCTFGSTIPIHFIFNDKAFNFMTFSRNGSVTDSVNIKDPAPTSLYIGGYTHLEEPAENYVNYESINVVSNTSSLIIDFGNSSQEIPTLFKTEFLKYFDKVYENVYTIKSTTGETLTTLTEAPPMISATLSSVGNAKYLTLKGENNTNYTMEWTSETPQGKIFAGLATSKGGSIAIPVGETVTINLTDSTDLYEVWQTYRPPTTTFEIKTYNYSGETSRVDKTDYLTPISTLSGVLRGEASLLNFNVLIQSDTVPNFNYCYIDKFKRYYYVTEPVSVRQNLWEMTMQVDALMTYKDSLLKCEGYIDRNEYIQNKMIIDNNRAIMQGADFEEDTITNELFGSGSFVLSGLRIGTKEK